MTEKKKDKWHKRAWDWAYRHGLTPLNKRFWALVIVGKGLHDNDAAIIGVGLTAFGAGEYHAYKSKDRDSAIDSAEKAYQKARTLYNGGSK